MTFREIYDLIISELSGLDEVDYWFAADDRAPDEDGYYDPDSEAPMFFQYAVDNVYGQAYMRVEFIEQQKVIPVLFMCSFDLISNKKDFKRLHSIGEQVEKILVQKGYNKKAIRKGKKV